MEFDRAVVKDHIVDRNWHGAEFTSNARRGETTWFKKIRLCDGGGFEAVGGDVVGGGCDFGDADFGVAVSYGGVGIGS